MVEWHRPDLDPEDIAKIIREGREENDKKFDTYREYVDYIVKDNERILKDYGDYIDPSLISIEEINEDDDLSELIDDNMDEKFISSVDGSEISFKELMEIAFNQNKQVLDKLGSDYDEDGKPYWEKNVQE